MKAFHLVLAMLMTWAAGALASPTEKAEAAVREGVAEVLAVTEKSQGGLPMAAQLQSVLDTRVSFDAMTRRAIGPGWRQFSAAEQAEAVRLFSKLVVRNYSKKFTPGEQPEVKYLKPTSPAPDKVEVPTTMLYKGGRYSVLYRLEDSRGKWLVTDMQVEGVSFISNYRAQFDALFKKGGVAAVMDSLKQSTVAP